MCLHTLPHKVVPSHTFADCPVGGVFYDPVLHDGLWLQKLDDASAAFVNDEGDANDEFVVGYDAADPVRFAAF